jgi:magnesium chelatase subunit D
MQEALVQARGLRLSGHATLLVDTAPRPAKLARELADTLGAAYLAMPYADAARLSRAVQSAMPVTG